MKLEIKTERDALVIRCQAWAYANVLNGKYGQAEKLFAERLAAFDNMAEHNPTDSMGFWAGHYYQSFIAACQARSLDRL